MEMLKTQLESWLSTIEFTESGSFDFGAVGILVGALVKSESYKDKQDFVKADDKTKADKDDSRIIASVDVQPVAYVTDNFHVALDVNKIYKSRIKPDERGGALYVTPIARYSLETFLKLKLGSVVL